MLAVCLAGACSLLPRSLYHFAYSPCTERTHRLYSYLCPFRLRFPVPPQIDTHFFPSKIEVEEGSRARLLCSVSKGDTPIRISWMRHGKILDTVPEGSVQYSDDSAMIKFKKVRFDDRGEYTCFAANQVSSVNQTTIVNVLGELELTE